MNKNEKKMVAILEDLKCNYGVIGIKAEFEAEGTRIEEGIRLKEIISSAGLGLTLKIGGCEALRDMYDARILGVERVIAPMIESSFALKKFVESFNKAFSEEEREDIFFAINLETKNTYQNIDEILNSEDISSIDGVVVGRNDLSYSIGMTRNGINSDETMKIASEMIVKSKSKGLICGMGGGVSAASVPIFEKLVNDSLDYFETRKVIFDYHKGSSSDFETGILKALNFETLWLKNKRDFYQKIFQEDEARIKTLEERYGHTMLERGID